MRYNLYNHYSAQLSIIVHKNMASIFSQMRKFQEEQSSFNKDQQALNFFEECIKEIYDGKITIAEVDNLSKKLNFEIGYGSLYTFIRDRLQKVCKSHRSLISSSASVFVKNSSNYYRTNIVGSG